MLFLYNHSAKPFRLQSYGKAISQWRNFKKSPASCGGSIFRIFLLSYFADFAVLSSRKGKARVEVKKKQSFTYLFNERASARIKVKDMKNYTHPAHEAARKLNFDLYKSGHESAAMQHGYIGIFKHVKDARYRFGYRKELIAKFVTYEAAYEYIVNNILHYTLD